MNYRIITVKNYFGKGRHAQILLRISYCNHTLSVTSGLPPDNKASNSVTVETEFRAADHAYSERTNTDGVPMAQQVIEDYSERSARAFMDRAHASMKLAK